MAKSIQIIFTAAYSQFALESYEYSAVDYLLKPVRYERFLMAVNKLKSNLSIDNNNEEEKIITIKSGYEIIKLKFEYIIFIEGIKEYVAFHTPAKRTLSYMPLKYLESILPKSIFLRIHRSFIINRNHVKSLVKNKIFIKNQTLPVSKTYLKKIKAELFKD